MIRHNAGKMIDWVQQCTRCLKIFANYQGKVSPDDYAIPLGWPEGPVIEHEDHSSAGDEPGAADCAPMNVVEAFEHDERQS